MLEGVAVEAFRTRTYWSMMDACAHGIDTARAGAWVDTLVAKTSFVESTVRVGQAFWPTVRTPLIFRKSTGVTHGGFTHRRAKSSCPTRRR